MVSYTNSDRQWAFWIGQELEKLGHRPRILDWEIQAGGDIRAWMEERLEKADRVLCVVSSAYLTQDYSGWERRSAQRAAASQQTNFILPVFIEDCEAPVAMAHIKRCALFGLPEEDARNQFAAYLAEAKAPAGPLRFPGAAKRAPSVTVDFPDGASAAGGARIAVGKKDARKSGGKKSAAKKGAGRKTAAKKTATKRAPSKRKKTAPVPPKTSPPMA